MSFCEQTALFDGDSTIALPFQVCVLEEELQFIHRQQADALANTPPNSSACRTVLGRAAADNGIEFLRGTLEWWELRWQQNQAALHVPPSSTSDPYHILLRVACDLRAVAVVQQCSFAVQEVGLGAKMESFSELLVDALRSLCVFSSALTRVLHPALSNFVRTPENYGKFEGGQSAVEDVQSLVQQMVRLAHSARLHTSSAEVQ